MNMSVEHQECARGRVCLGGPKRSWLALTATLFLLACSGIDYRPSTIADANRALEAGYVLNPGDKVRVTVFGEPNLTGEFEIDKSGMLVLPLIQETPAAGRTARWVADAVTRALADGGYVLDPRVSVETQSYRPIYVLGEVNQPGEYTYAPDITYLQVIAKAGGYTPRANRQKVVLQRAGWTEPKMIELSATPLLVGPGDTLIVEESFF